MSHLAEVTPLVLTFNEAANIGRTLDRLRWATRVVVVDSGSTDETATLCRAYPNVELVERRFDNHVAQWNFGLAQVQTPWVLSLDADYVLTDELIAELQQWDPASDVAAYAAAFVYCVSGRALRASLYPPRTVLFRRDAATYVSDGHTQLLKVDGATGRLTHQIRHDDRKGLDRWFAEQIRYADLEARHLSEPRNAPFNRVDRIRQRIVLAPVAVAPYLLIGKGLALDGWPGVHYTLQRVIAELLLSLRLLDVRLRGGTNSEVSVRA